MVTSLIESAHEANSADGKSLNEKAGKTKTELKETTKKIVLQIDEAKESCN